MKLNLIGLTEIPAHDLAVESTIVLFCWFSTNLPHENVKMHLFLLSQIIDICYTRKNWQIFLGPFI